MDLTTQEKFNHRCEVTGGVMEGECRAVLRDFLCRDGKRKDRKNNEQTGGDPAGRKRDLRRVCEIWNEVVLAANAFPETRRWTKRRWNNF
ncbi:MAG: hypothetical protein ACLT0Y_06710 [Christensenellales bacterium]